MDNCCSCGRRGTDECLGSGWVAVGELERINTNILSFLKLCQCEIHGGLVCSAMMTLMQKHSYIILICK